MTHLLPVFVAVALLIAAYGLIYGIYVCKVPIIIRYLNDNGVAASFGQG
jgi:hypothetical protein